MPIVSVHEHGNTLPNKYDIRASGKIRNIFSVAETKPVQCTAKIPFNSISNRAYRRHIARDFGARLWPIARYSPPS